MISEAIRHVVNEGWVTVKELAELAGVSDSTISRWQTDQTKPDWDAVRQWVRHHKDERVQMAFVRCLVVGTAIEVRLPSGGAGLDVDHDGVIRGSDAIAAMLTAAEQLTHELREIHAALQDGELSDAEMIRLQEQRRSVEAAIAQGMAVLEHLRGQSKRRKPARAPVVLARTA